MKASRTEREKGHELTLNDFAASPIWTWSEDERSLVPVEHSLVLPEDHDALFILAKLVLADGSTIDAVLGLRVSDHKVYLIEFPNAEGKFLSFSLQPQLRHLVTREQVATWLQKPLEGIFPIHYSIPYVFSDGQPLVGQIE